MPPLLTLAAISIAALAGVVAMFAAYWHPVRSLLYVALLPVLLYLLMGGPFGDDGKNLVIAGILGWIIYSSLLPFTVLFAGIGAMVRWGERLEAAESTRLARTE